MAVAYQLVTDRTNFLLVHARAEGEAPTELPELHKVAQMLPAGWGAVGSVLGAPPSPAMRFSRTTPAGAMQTGTPPSASPSQNPTAWDQPLGAGTFATRIGLLSIVESARHCRGRHAQSQTSTILTCPPSCAATRPICHLPRNPTEDQQNGTAVG